MRNKKVCHKCWELKLKSLFGSRKDTKDKLRTICRRCDTELRQLSRISKRNTNDPVFY